MSSNKQKLEDFKTAISSTVRSLANSKKIEVYFGNQLAKSNENSIKLPDLDKLSNNVNFEEIRD